MQATRVMPMRAADGTAGPPVLTAVSLAPMVGRFATGGDDHVVRIWNLDRTERYVRELRSHSDWVRAVVYNPQGQVIASAGDDHHILYWDAATGQLLRTLPGAVAGRLLPGFQPRRQGSGRRGLRRQGAPLRRHERRSRCAN